MGNTLKDLKANFTLPFEPHDYQIESVDDIVPLDCSLLRHKVGLGKTFISLMAALTYSLDADSDIEQILVICPPILMDQWYEFTQEVGGIPGVLLYRGSPTERKLMDIDESVVIVSYNIFRADRDFKRFQAQAKKSKLCVIADELSLKSLSSRTYQRMKDILYRKRRLTLDDKPFHKLIALNATPISDPSHVYNWCSLMVPGVYKSKRLFEAAYAVEVDHWGKVTEWRDEESMNKSMNLFSIDTAKDVKLPPLIETVVPYQLSKKHMDLYKATEEAQFMQLPDDKLELALNAMFTVLQQIVLLPHEFGVAESPPVLEFIDGYIDQMNSADGLLVYSRHVKVSEMLEEEIPDCGAIYGKVKKKRREEIFAQLKDRSLRRLVGNLDSLGIGLNLQMLNHVIFAELPFRSDKLTQSIGRLHRQGQLETCFVSYPIAVGTVQEKIYHNLLKNKKELQPILKTKKDVEKFLFDK